MKKAIIIIFVVLLSVGLYLNYKTVKVENINDTPSPSQVSGKLNIDVVCEGALAYMTFPDGASADVFVKECKEGKHPEVIEKYKKDMNLRDGAQI